MSSSTAAEAGVGTVAVPRRLGRAAPGGNFVDFAPQPRAGVCAQVLRPGLAGLGDTVRPA